MRITIDNNGVIFQDEYHELGEFMLPLVGDLQVEVKIIKIDRKLIAEPDIEIGDRVLATEHKNGDLSEEYFVGFIKEINAAITPPQYTIVDSIDRQTAGAYGFRRVDRITEAESDRLKVILPHIAGVPGRSLWWHLAVIRGEENPVDPCVFGD